MEARTAAAATGAWPSCPHHHSHRPQAYPFLAQVCRHWKGVLESREALPALWSELVVDFSHELITGACGRRLPCLPATVCSCMEGFCCLKALPLLGLFCCVANEVRSRAAYANCPAALPLQACTCRCGGAMCGPAMRSSGRCARRLPLFIQLHPAAAAHPAYILYTLPAEHGLLLQHITAEWHTAWQLQRHIA